jgi:WD40 repeat protein
LLASLKVKAESPLNQTLEGIVLKALEKDPDNRYQSAGELARDIDRYLSGLKTTCAVPTSVGNSRSQTRPRWGLGTKFVRRAGIVVLVLIGGGGIVLLLPMMRQETASRPRNATPVSATRQTGAATDIPPPQVEKNIATVVQLCSYDVGRPALSPAGHTAACQVSGTNRVEVWNLDKGQVIRTLLKNDIGAMAFSPDGKRLAAGGWVADPRISIWDLADGKECASLPGIRWGTPSIMFSPDGRDITAAGMQSVITWDVNTGAELFHITGNTIAYVSGDLRTSTHRALVLDGLNILLRDTQTGEELLRMVAPALVAQQRTISGEPEPYLAPHVGCALFSPDGRIAASLLSHAGDRSIILWNLSNGTLIRHIASQSPEPLLSVAFSPDGQILASVGSDSVVAGDSIVRLWAVSTGQEIQTATLPYPTTLASCAFITDGRALVVSTSSGLYLVRCNAELGKER